MDHPEKPRHLTRATHQRPARHTQAVFGRRGLMTLAAGAGVAAIGTAGRGLFLP